MTTPREFPPRSSGDAELDALLGAEADLLETARLLHEAAPEPVLDQSFRLQLRAQVMAEASRRTAPRQSWWQRRASMIPAVLAGGTGLALVAATIILVVATPVQKPAWSAPVADVHNAPTADAITVSFNQPMDQSAVVAGLHIQPAAAVTTSWQGNTLVITPVHPLTPDTAYTVSIDQSAVKTVTGTPASAAVTFSFGTAPTPTASPTPTPATTPVLQPSLLSTISSPTLLGFAPDGSALVSGSITAGAPSPTPAASATSSPTASPPSSSVQPSLTPSASAAPDNNATYVLRSGSAPLCLGAAAVAAAYSPDGTHIAVATAPTDSTGNAVSIVAADGSGPAHLIDTANPVVALVWTSADSLDVVTTGTVQTVGTDGHHQFIARASTDEKFTAITSSGRFVTAAMADAVRVIDLSNGAITTLPGAASLTWSADGSTAAWLHDGQLEVATASHLAAPDGRVGIPSGFAVLTTLALNRNGTTVAIADATGRINVLDAGNGTVLATGSQSGAVVFSPSADKLFTTATDSTGQTGVYVSSVPAAATQPSGGAPTIAVTTVNAFVAAQVKGDTTTMTTLAAPGVDVTATPPGLSRGYVVAVALDNGGSVTAQARLLVDPSATHSVAAFADETLTLSSDGKGGFQISKLSIGPLTDEPSGPHVIHISSQHGSSVISIAFDSDLEATTVAKSIKVTAAGADVPVAVTYAAAARTATVTLTTMTHGAITLTVATTLTDIAGQPLAKAYSVNLAS